VKLEPVNNVGELREQIWSNLVRENAAAYPMPPHGHNPNFKGARAAAKNLMLHPILKDSSVVLVGMEAALLPLREMILEAEKTLIVPHRTKKDAYWKLVNVPKKAARIGNFHLFGSSCDLIGVQCAVIASVALDTRGLRLSKGFGFTAQGASAHVPTLSIAHESMVLENLRFSPDSVVIAFATPLRLVICSSNERPHEERVLNQP
jgi:5-formyltetrahydrofolate cyclo-ligase